jgi:hypothetical protein
MQSRLVLPPRSNSPPRSEHRALTQGQRCWYGGTARAFATHAGFLRQQENGGDG